MFENVRFVFFDVGSTLLFANRERMLEPLHARGIRPSEEKLKSMECKVKNEFDAVMEQDGKADHGFWDMFYARLFGELGLQDETLRRQLIANTRLSMNWNRIRPGTREAPGADRWKIRDGSDLERGRTHCGAARRVRPGRLLPHDHRFGRGGA